MSCLFVHVSQVNELPVIRGSKTPRKLAKGRKPWKLLKENYLIPPLCSHGTFERKEDFLSQRNTFSNWRSSSWVLPHLYMTTNLGWFLLRKAHQQQLLMSVFAFGEINYALSFLRWRRQQYNWKIIIDISWKKTLYMHVCIIDDARDKESAFTFDKNSKIRLKQLKTVKIRKSNKSLISVTPFLH